MKNKIIPPLTPFNKALAVKLWRRLRGCEEIFIPDPKSPSLPSVTSFCTAGLSDVCNVVFAADGDEDKAWKILITKYGVK